VRGPKRGSGPRSNAYSESKCSNWTRFDPFVSEVRALPANLRPDMLAPLQSGEDVAIFVRPLHADFVRPFSPEAVRDALAVLPGEFVSGLDAVYLLAGSSKQAKVALGDLSRYGCYGYGKIFLYAFPKRTMAYRLKRSPKPSVMQQYVRAGATLIQDSGGYELRFTESALRQFYLTEVLLHEVAHHVMRDGPQKNRRAEERFADWFAHNRAQKLKRK